jgi:hypothetical protein
MKIWNNYFYFTCGYWGRQVGAETLADIIQTGDTPLIIGMWESGKISLMIW